MKLPLPTKEPTTEEELLDEHGLSKEMARKLHAAACQGHVGKAWKQMRFPPPSKLTMEVWEEPKGKLKPHADAPLHRWMPKAGMPLLSHAPRSSMNSNTTKLLLWGGWTTESATAMSLLMLDIIWSKAPNVSLVAYVDDTVLLGAFKWRPPWAASNSKKPTHKSGLPRRIP